MKIEMGESLVRTWVRHCFECQLAELNWKPSPLWPINDSPVVEQWYTDGKTQFPEQVFKKTATLEQFLRQAEIDVFGINVIQGRVKKIIAADIAFHKKGLSYGTTFETKARIIKKLFRAALTIRRHFPDIPAKILFLSPKVSPATAICVKEAGQILQTFFATRYNHFQIDTIINAQFKSSILDEVVKIQHSVDDTSELFLRSVQLVALFGKSSLLLPKMTGSPGMTDRPISPQTLTIELEPSNHNEFMKLLLKHRKATIYEYHQDGTCEKKYWDIERLNENSSITKNLRSRPNYRQGKWQKLNITKLVVKIYDLDDQTQKQQ